MLKEGKKAIRSDKTQYKAAIMEAKAMFSEGFVLRFKYRIETLSFSFFAFSMILVIYKMCVFKQTIGKGYNIGGL